MCSSAKVPRLRPAYERSRRVNRMSAGSKRTAQPSVGAIMGAARRHRRLQVTLQSQAAVTITRVSWHVTAQLPVWAATQATKTTSLRAPLWTLIRATTTAARCRAMATLCVGVPPTVQARSHQLISDGGIKPSPPADPTHARSQVGATLDAGEHLPVATAAKPPYRKEVGNPRMDSGAVSLALLLETARYHRHDAPMPLPMTKFVKRLISLEA